jgi:Holliday junction resolvase-like predicted endonuclease
MENNDTVIEILELHRNELQMLRDMRTRFKFGEITIIMRDGLPVRWKRITEFGEPCPPV